MLPACAAATEEAAAARSGAAVRSGGGARSSGSHASGGSRSEGAAGGGDRARRSGCIRAERAHSAACRSKSTRPRQGAAGGGARASASGGGLPPRPAALHPAQWQAMTTACRTGTPHQLPVEQGALAAPPARRSPTATFPPLLQAVKAPERRAARTALHKEESALRRARSVLGTNYKDMESARL